jgi:hypothetical protein
VSLRYPNLPAFGSDVPTSVRRAFAELQSFFTSLKTLNPDGINQNLASVIFQRDNGNDRNPAAITPPTIASDGTAVDHTISTDSSANISFEWSWTGNEADIDGWTVYVRSSTSSSAYTMGTTPAEEQTFQLPADRRAIILRGQPANLYYTFGVRAFRNVDLVIAPNGLVRSPLVQPSLAAEAPYQPAANVAFTGDITGTTAWGSLGDLAVLDTVDTPQIADDAVETVTVATGATAAAIALLTESGSTLPAVGSTVVAADSYGAAGDYPIYVSGAGDLVSVNFAALVVATVRASAIGGHFTSYTRIYRKIGAGSWTLLRQTGQRTAVEQATTDIPVVHNHSEPWPDFPAASAGSIVYYKVEAWYDTVNITSVADNTISQRVLSATLLKKPGAS